MSQNETTQMKMAYRQQYGGSEKLSIIQSPIPHINDHQILVKVHFTTVNRTDCGILKGKPYLIRAFTGLRKPKHQTTGTDFSGEVAAVGAAVKNFRVGDRIRGFNDNGLQSHAQYMVTDEKQHIRAIPDGVSYEQAAASAEGPHYAYTYLQEVQKAGREKLLVYGASGAIGSAAVQMGVYLGYQVTAVTNTRNMEAVSSLGAHKLIDYQKKDFARGEENYDAVLDAVGKSCFGDCKSILKDGGYYMSSELGPGAENLYLPLITRIRGGKKVKFPLPLDIPGSMDFMQKMLEEGKYHALIDRSYPPEKIREAFSYVDSGQKTGNVLISWHA